MLDRPDRILLLELDRNCRRPLTDLARASGLAIETARFRIERLLSRGVIKNFLTVVDGGRLGFYYYKVFFRLKNVREETISRIAADLASNDRICWVVRLDGNFDLGFTPRVTDPIEQSKLLDELRTKYTAYISRWTLSVNIRMYFFARDFLVKGGERRALLGSYSARSDGVALDSVAQSVLDRLAREPTVSAAAIARQIGVSTDTVLKRIRLLERQKVIVRYSLVTDTALLGQVAFYTLIYLGSFTGKREDEFVKFCSKQAHIVYLIKSLGEWDYELSIECDNVQEYRDLMMRLAREFSDIVQEYTTLIVSKIHRYRYP